MNFNIFTYEIGLDWIGKAIYRIPVEHDCLESNQRVSLNRYLESKHKKGLGITLELVVNILDAITFDVDIW